jgi:predicted Zn-dependent protease
LAVKEGQMRLILLAVFSGAVLAAQEPTLKQQLQPRYSEAIRAYNAGRIVEARSLLQKLLTEHPDSMSKPLVRPVRLEQV